MSMRTPVLYVYLALNHLPSPNGTIFHHFYLRSQQFLYDCPSSVHSESCRASCVWFTDTWSDLWGEPDHHGSPVRRAVEQGLIDPKRTVRMCKQPCIFDAFYKVHTPFCQDQFQTAVGLESADAIWVCTGDDWHQRCADVCRWLGVLQ